MTVGGMGTIANAADEDERSPEGRTSAATTAPGPAKAGFTPAAEQPPLQEVAHDSTPTTLGGVTGAHLSAAALLVTSGTVSLAVALSPDDFHLLTSSTAILKPRIVTWLCTGWGL